MPPNLYKFRSSVELRAFDVSLTKYFTVYCTLKNNLNYNFNMQHNMKIHETAVHKEYVITNYRIFLNLLCDEYSFQPRPLCANDQDCFASNVHIICCL
jgi:hypothetical protein